MIDMRPVLAMRAEFWFTDRGQSHRKRLAVTLTGHTSDAVLRKWGEIIDTLRAIDGTVSSVCHPISKIDVLELDPI